MRYKWIAAFFLIPSLAMAVNYTINTYSTDPKIQSELVAYTTTYYDAKISQSAYFPTTITVTVTGKKPIPPPPPPPPASSSGIVTSQDLLNTIIRISTDTYVYGFSSGMEEERLQVIGLVNMLQGVDFSSSTCGGMPFVVPVSTSSFDQKNAVLQTCMNSYNVIKSTIAQRGYMIFTATGGVVSP